MVAKTLALSLLTIATSTCALAAPQMPAPVAEGTYAFSGDLHVDIKLQYRVVYGFTDAGAAELAKRLKAGEECSNTGREIYLCKSFGSTDGAAELVRSRVARDLGGKTLAVGALRGEPGLIRQGTDVAEYLVPQHAEFAGKAYDTYRLVNMQGNWSVRLGEPTEVQFNLRDGRMEMPVDVPVTLSREAYDVYGVGAGFTQK